MRLRIIWIIITIAILIQAGAIFIFTTAFSAKLRFAIAACSARRLREAYVECINAWSPLLVKNFGARVALALISQNSEVSLATKLGCNEAASAIGKVSRDLGQCTSVCGNGCSRGVISERWKNNPENISAEWLGATCKNSSDCAEGGGEAIMKIKDYALFDALKICDAIQKEARIACYRGVFRENALHPERTAYLNEKQPFFPCIAVPETYRAACFYSLGPWLFLLVKGNTADARALCQIAPPEFTQNCTEGLGRFNR